MAVVSFWSKGKKETGQTSAVIAVATHMAIEHNYKILVISTSVKEDTMGNAFWEKERKKRNLGLFGPNTNAVMQNGIEGLNRIVRSNKVSPDIITNYARTVFKDRLEVLLSYRGEEQVYKEIRSSYPAIIELAKKYYDLVIVDIDYNVGEDVEKEILHNSDVIVVTMPQRFSSIDQYKEAKKNNQMLQSPKTLLLVGRYDKFSKYNAKNITRYLKEKNEVNTIPYNTLFFEACEEASVTDLFLRLRRISDETDRNVLFLKEVKRLSDNILYRIQDIQMRKQ
ncbi:MAG: hypothetical protein IKF83_03045 [Clostridia bacterium]|nr:hypothetical protein [Clostridia bacterium]